ncbi:hypothetical protein [Heyndrickxia coagulans]|uniref:hypothetical protein n=1 Tax=Heyndrickxia coagulans TaxID=1398 RepID=UPI003F599B61
MHLKIGRVSFEIKLKNKRKGKEEGEEKLKRFIANLLKNQVDLKIIAQASGLSEEEILKIKRQIEGEKH